MAASLSVAKAAEASVFPIASEQIIKASKALLSHMRKATKEASANASKKNLLEDDEGSDVAQEPIWLNLTTKRNVRDDNSLKPGRVTVPHPLIPADSEATICLIVADPQRAYKDIVASDEFPAALAKRITRVIDVTHLQSKFRTFEAQRQLLAAHDVFLADDRIINRLPKCLGKTFYRSTAKRPIPVYLAPRKPKSDKGQQQPKKKGSGKKEKGDEASARPAAEIAAEVQAATGAALVHLSPSTSTAVKVGFGGWTAEEVAENVAAVARTLVERHTPRKWANVRSVFLKGATTAALPLWQTDELWLDGAKDVLPEGSEELRALEDKKKEKPNVGRKRKALEEAAAAAEDATEAEESEDAVAAEVKKPAKKKAKVPLAESNDDNLDKQIKERKEKLKKQKKKAKLAMED